jgi:hypothetical protein
MEEMPPLNMPVQRLTTGLTLLWARNPFRGNFNHWQVSQKEAGQIFFLKHHEQKQAMHKYK